MSAVTSAARIVTIIGARPNVSALELLREAGPNVCTLLLVLGPRPSPGQQRLVADVLDLADDRRIPVTVELVETPSKLPELLRADDAIRSTLGRRERHRWHVSAESGLTARDAR